jgi:hypothetical protein
MSKTMYYIATVVLLILHITSSSYQLHHVLQEARIDKNVKAVTWHVGCLLDDTGFAVSCGSVAVSMLCSMRIKPHNLGWKFATQLVVFIWSFQSGHFYDRSGIICKFFVHSIFACLMEFCCVQGGNEYTECDASEEKIAEAGLRGGGVPTPEAVRTAARRAELRAQWE